MSPPRLLPPLPEFEVTLLYEVKKRIKAFDIVEAERTARILVSDGRARLHSS